MHTREAKIPAAVLLLTVLVAFPAAGDVPSGYERCNLPYRFYQFPDNFDPWEQWDEPLMDQWDTFADVMFYGAPSGTFAPGNGKSELAGFLTNAQLNDYFGYSWGDAVGLTFLWANWQDCLVEADIALNADWDCWTVDIAENLSDPNCLPYQTTLIHELGHTFGLEDYNYRSADEDKALSYNSVMNYAHPWYSYALGHDDGVTIQNLYPSAANNIHDVGIYSYYCTSQYNCPDARTDRSQVSQGGTFRIENLQVANPGRFSESGVVVTFYLSSDIEIGGGDFELGSATFNNLAAGANASVDADLDVPGDAPTGSFYVGAVISVPSDALAENDTMFLPRKLKVVAGDDDDDDDNDDADDDDATDDDSSDDDDDTAPLDCEDICNKLVTCDYTNDYELCLSRCDDLSRDVARCIEEARSCAEVSVCMGEGEGGGDDDDDNGFCG